MKTEVMNIIKMFLINRFVDWIPFMENNIDNVLISIQSDLHLLGAYEKLEGLFQKENPYRESNLNSDYYRTLKKMYNLAKWIRKAEERKCRSSKKR